MKLTHKLAGNGAALLALALLPGTAHAGNLLPYAILPLGIGELDTLTGSLTFTTVGTERATAQQSLADLYAINLTGGAFSATTVGTTGNPLNPSTDVSNTVLYLFNSSGIGVMTNDDDPSGLGANQFRSTISSSTLAPGQYYLGVSTFGYEPASAGGLIFPDQTSSGTDPAATYGPTGPGAAGSLSTWRTTGNDLEAGTYSIAMTGVVYSASVPEPSPIALLLAGGGALLAFGLRRRRA